MGGVVVMWRGLGVAGIVVFRRGRDGVGQCFLGWVLALDRLKGRRDEGGRRDSPGLLGETGRTSCLSW